MGTIAEKLSYLDETREQILSNINALGGDLTEEDTFRSYAKELDNIWEEQPHTTETGTSLSLNTKKGKAKVDLDGNTSQETTTGKNKINVPSDYSVTGTQVIELTIPSGTTITTSLDRVTLGGENNATIRYVDSEEHDIGGYFYVSSSNLTNTRTLSANLSKIIIYSGSSYVDSQGKTSIFKNLMLEIGSSKTSYEPYTNGASPNPSYPQPVNVVSGDNEVVVTGKNLFDESILNTYKVDEDSEAYIFNGNTLYNKNLTPNITFKANTAYTIQYNAKQTSGNPRLAIVYTDGTRVGIGYNEYGHIYTYYDTYTITSNSSKTIDYISEDYGSNVSNNFYIKKGSVCIVEGNDTTFYPYTSTSYPIHLGELELCKISTYQDRFLRNSGKQVWDEEWEVGAYAWATGEKVVNYSTIRSKNKMPIKPSTTYYVTIPSEIVIEFFDSSDTFLGSSANVNKNSSASFTTPSNASYFVLYMTSAYGTTYKNDIMLNEGSTALPYEPYGTNEWYLEKKIGKVVLDGSEDENWELRSTNYFVCGILLSIIATTTSNSVCNIATPVTIGNLNASSVNKYASNNSYLWFRLAQFNNDLSAFKTHLETTNAIVYYVLATPTYTKITGTLKDELEAVWRANSYKGTTNISQVNNDLPFILDVTALAGETE